MLADRGDDGNAQLARTLKKTQAVGDGGVVAISSFILVFSLTVATDKVACPPAFLISWTTSSKIVREGCGKSKWKFKMAFAMKGGGLEGVSSATYLF